MRILLNLSLVLTAVAFFLMLLVRFAYSATEWLFAQPILGNLIQAHAGDHAALKTTAVITVLSGVVIVVGVRRFVRRVSWGKAGAR